MSDRLGVRAHWKRWYREVVSTWVILIVIVHTTTDTHYAYCYNASYVEQCLLRLFRRQYSNSHDSRLARASVGRISFM